jgi:hypothetical protein
MDQATFEALVALLIPIIVGVVKKDAFSNLANSVIAIVIYILAGIAWVIFSGQTIDMQNLVPTITQFVTEGTAAYVLFWKTLSAAFATKGVKFLAWPR